MPKTQVLDLEIFFIEPKSKTFGFCVHGMNARENQLFIL